MKLTVTVVAMRPEVAEVEIDTEVCGVDDIDQLCELAAGLDYYGEDPADLPDGVTLRAPWHPHEFGDTAIDTISRDGTRLPVPLFWQACNVEGYNLPYQLAEVVRAWRADPQSLTPELYERLQLAGEELHVNHLHPDALSRWYEEHDAAAHEDGWSLFTTDHDPWDGEHEAVEIQRVDDADRFDDDDAAALHVHAAAARGDAAAGTALEVLRQLAPGEVDRVFALAREAVEAAR